MTRRYPWLPGAFRFVLAYVLLQFLLFLAPQLYARVLLPVLPMASRLGDTDLRVLHADMEDRSVAMRVESRKLVRFINEEGKKGPAFDFTAYQRLSALNLYPLVMISILLIFPLSRYRLAVIIPTALVVLVLLGVLDLMMAYHWLAAEALEQLGKTAGTMIPRTPDNIAVIARYEREIHHLTTLKSSLSAGGRQFLALGGAGVCLLAGYRFPSR